MKTCDEETMHFMHEIIKKNIERLLEERHWNVGILEKKLNMTNRRSITNIFRGISKNPSVEVIKGVSDALQVPIEEIVDENKIYYIKDFVFCIEILNQIIVDLQMIEPHLKMSFDALIKIYSKVFRYHSDLNLEKIDLNFIKWTIKIP